MRKAFIIVFVLFMHSSLLISQNQKSIDLTGYLTSMQSSMFDSVSGDFMNENLLHNRLNFKAYLGDLVTFSAEFRNRLFTGDMVRLGNNYSNMIDTDDGWMDLSWNLAEGKSFLINTTIDRLWIDFHYNNFQLTAGRQRINWGQALVWNPNDIFNTYSFFDLDYIERPGSDALRMQYFTNSLSVIELVAKIDFNDNMTVAGLYRFNAWSYDIQFLAGIVESNDFVLGAGWSGAIGNLSFRGESSWFKSLKLNENTLLITAGVDKMFKDNSMVQVQLMYCNNPLSDFDFTSFYSGNLSTKNIAFSEFSAFGQFTWALSPLFNATIAGMVFPDLKGYFISPSIGYSLAENLDFSLIWQYFDALIDLNDTRTNICFLKLKYNF
ncbi:MAG: hypothetical protein RBT49_06200 [Bacteroidales bacterium]|jgi:hypothetical protein|nr:hypothetical protein [Bacteroidales bacterium]